MTDGAGPRPDGADGMEIRPLADRAEREGCVALQERVWGPAFADRVPASVLMIALETGGVASGAFVDGELVAFVFGITGLREGRPVHWSDMLAVAPEHRGRGIGFRLKLHQRSLLLERGVETVRWTFEPLEARNAHLNLRRLGAVVREYRRDVYGASDSPLHAGIGTDRLVAEWSIASARVRRLLDGGPSGGEAAVGGDPVESSDPVPSGDPASEPSARIAIPADLQALKAADPGRALEWRKEVRAEFERAFEGGWVAVDLERPSVGPADGEKPAEAVAHYVLAPGFSL